MDSKLLINAKNLQNLLVAYSTGQGDEDSDFNYIELRSALLGDPSIRALLPEFVKKNRSLDQFWAFIKQKFSHYQERRVFLWEEFQPLLDKLEAVTENPASESMEIAVRKFNIEDVNSTWDKIYKRRDNDPEGSITAARTMLEGVCKYVLDENNIVYKSSTDLPELYRLVARNLNLAPDNYTEEIFKQTLGGVFSVVNGLAAVRNKLGDAHGKGKNSHKPHPRHAELVINLAGTVSVFILETFKMRKLKSGI